MDLRTGEVIPMEDAVRRNNEAGADVCVPLEDSIMERITADQKKRLENDEQPVVKDADNSSYLGTFKNSHKNKPCFCGSKKKFKKCCMFKVNIANFDNKDE